MEAAGHRVILVSGGVPLGGSTTFLLNLGGEMIRRRIPVLVVSLEGDNPYASDFERLKIPLHLEDDRTTIFEDRVFSALNVIRAFGPTAIVACLGPSSYEVLRYIPKEVNRLALLQSDFPENYIPLRLYIEFLDGTAGVSRQIQENLQADPVLSQRPSYYLPYGVFIPDGRNRTNEGREPIRILYLGRLCRPQKRVQLFPLILRQLIAANIPFEWSVVGDGPERHWLERQMHSIAPKQVRFVGPVSHAAVPNLLEVHDVLLLPSVAEGLPISLLEAMAYGLVPVVSNISSGVAELVDRRTGILIEPDDLGSYAAGIVTLARNRGQLTAMSHNAHSRIGDYYSIVAMTDRWVQVLDQLGIKSGAEWPGVFKVKGPLGAPSVWFTKPIRKMRRLLKQNRTRHRRSFSSEGVAAR